MLRHSTHRGPEELSNTVFEEKVIGVDWGDVTRWVLVGRKTKNKFYVIDTGVFDDMIPCIMLRS